MFNRTRDYLKDVRAEFDKVSWPNWEELKGQTIVVLVVSLILSIFIYAVDQVLNQIVRILLR
ncbi:preprotein translocase subunit SecE [Candidatus Zixiibacteriota bacterium]